MFHEIFHNYTQENCLKLSKILHKNKTEHKKIKKKVRKFFVIKLIRISKIFTDKLYFF